MTDRGSSAGRRSLVERDRAALWHPFTQVGTAPEPFPVVSAQGAWLVLEDGRRILDAVSSWWTIVHGHGEPSIGEAIARQARDLDHVMFAGCTHEGAVELAERLTAIAPAPLSRVFYSDDGSTAVEVGLKLAFQYWCNRQLPGKTGFVALDHGYHGDTLGAMAVGDLNDFDGVTFKPLLFKSERVHAAHSHACQPGEEPPTVERALGQLERLFTRQSSGLAALIMEPLVQAAGGMVLSPASYLKGVRELCTRHDVLLILDEVMTGFGRTGTLFACEQAGIAPDIMCLSKGVTGGVLPLGVTLATEWLYDEFVHTDTRRAFLHGHSYTANPIICAAALANLELFATRPVLEHVARIERFYARRLSGFADHPAVANVRWLGSLGVVELKSQGEGYFADVGPKLLRAFRERGLLVRPLGPVVYTLPPYVTTDEELELVYSALEEILRTL